MTWTDKRARIARLQRVQRRRAREDRQQGYATYRNKRPQASRTACRFCANAPHARPFVSYLTGLRQ